MNASFAEIAVTTNFSFLRGASHPKELVAAAALHGHAAIGIADRNTLAGIVRAYEGLNEVREKTGKTTKLLVGARLVFVDGTPDILAYPTDRPAYGRLCRLLSAGKLRAAKGECILTLDDLLEWQEGLLLVVMPPHPAREEAVGDPFRKSWNNTAAQTDGDIPNKSVIPAEAGTQLARVRARRESFSDTVLGPRLRGDDTQELRKERPRFIPSPPSARGKPGARRGARPARS